MARMKGGRMRARGPRRTVRTEDNTGFGGRFAPRGPQRFGGRFDNEDQFNPATDGDQGIPDDPYYGQQGGSRFAPRGSQRFGQNQYGDDVTPTALTPDYDDGVDPGYGGQQNFGVTRAPRGPGRYGQPQAGGEPAFGRGLSRRGGSRLMRRPTMGRIRRKKNY